MDNLIKCITCSNLFLKKTPHGFYCQKCNTTYPKKNNVYHFFKNGKLSYQPTSKKIYDILVSDSAKNWGFQWQNLVNHDKKNSAFFI